MVKPDRMPVWKSNVAGYQLEYNVASSDWVWGEANKMTA